MSVLNFSMFCVDLLFGVLTANLVWVATDFAVTPVQMAALSTAPADTAATYVVRFFVDWKFYRLFSFLFGLGFAVQMSRAAARGGYGKRVYLRRLAVLLGIGVLHLVFVWYGDILHVFAMLGLLLLACRNVSTKRLLLVSAVLILLSPYSPILLSPYSSLDMSGAATPAAGEDSNAARRFQRLRKETTQR